jgi:hypothetical protein
MAYNKVPQCVITGGGIVSGALFFKNIYRHTQHFLNIPAIATLVILF